MIIRPEESELLKDTIKLCLENKISVKLLNQKTIRRLYFGLFLTNPPELRIATKGYENDYSLFWSSFVHESCHVDQFLNKAKVFQEYILDGLDDENFPENYFKGEFSCKIKSKKFFNNILKMELDCEKRAIRKIKKYKLNINPITYTKQANLYMYYHVFMWKNKKELKGIEYKNPIFLGKMPKKLLTANEYWDTYDKLNLNWR